ncbi:MAG: response regulator [Bacteroidales bacterium]
MSKRVKTPDLVLSEEEKAKREAELVIANEEKEKRAAELLIANEEKKDRADELIIANQEKEKREAELIIANEEKAKREAELLVANAEKEKREVELVIANKEKAEREAELLVANAEKAKRVAELAIANKEKGNRAAELIIANADKAKRATELVIANAEKAKLAAVLIIANIEKEHRANEIVIADKEVIFQNEQKLKLASELVIADVNRTKLEAELVIANIEKTKRIAKNIITKAELSFQKEKTSKQAAKLVIADAEKAKRSAELVIANIEKAKRSAELVIANKELIYQKSEKSKRTAELVIAKVSKAKRSAELVIANIEKAKRSAEFVIVSKELLLSQEKEKLIEELTTVNEELGREIEMRMQSNEALKESEGRTHSIMENSADAIFLTNQQGKYLYTNREVSTMLGYTSEEMKSKTIADISPPDRIEEYYQFFDKIMKEGKVYTEIELVKKDGNYISTDLNAVLLPDGTVYGSCRDISERKKVESELTKAKEKAEESDRLKSAFLANMSHEIRTPMNGILGFAELLREPNLSSDDMQDYIQAIQISGARMLNTINSIVDISKIESGLIQINIGETDINKKMEFTYKFFKPEADIKGLQLILKTSLPDKEAFIKTDNEKIYGVLTNLVRNAIKFTFEGSVEFGYEKKGDYLEFYVKDTGVGIKDNQKELIFERFRQGSESHSRGYEGSGLGLAITKSYVTMLGGKISVESKEGIGSTFYFTVPYIKVPDEELKLLDTATDEYKDTQLNNLKILIVEDDEVSSSLLTRMLYNINRTILHAITGEEAVEACRNNLDIDLVLMDIRMPKMDGNEATRQIRQFNKDVIIIAQTAYAFAGDRKRAIDAGCNDYISKPIDRDLLITLILKYTSI